ncbi:MAG: HEAT repeat domain-containing protein [Actinomycetota bacterium]
MQPLENWLEKFGSDDVDVRVRAAHQLVARPDVPLGVLVVMLEDLDGRGIGAKAIQALLGRTDPDLFDAMVACLGSSTPLARQAGAEVLGHLGDPRATPHLINLLDDPVWLVRRAAALALGSLGDPSAIRPLERQLEVVVADQTMEVVLRGSLRRLRALDPG